MQKKQLMHRRPSYQDGQLLLADDFIREQKYHDTLMHRHSLHLHGTGVVRGLEVSSASDQSLAVSPGVALDGRGREILLGKAEVLDLTGAPASSQLSVTVGYRSEWQRKDDDPNIDCFAMLRVSGGVDEYDVLLATVRLDDRGRIAAGGVDNSVRRLLHMPRVGWLRMPFRPVAIPFDQENAPPPFRMGATKAVAHKLIRDLAKKEKDSSATTPKRRWSLEGDDKNPYGAGGTMTIVLPPQATQVHKLRVAGDANEKKITFRLMKGGWDSKSMKHVAVNLLVEEAPDERRYVEIEGSPYDRTFEVPEAKRLIDPECSTLSIELLCTGHGAVSLIAVQFSY